MKRLSIFLFSFVLLVFLVGSTCVFSMVQVGEEVSQRLETPHPYRADKGVVWEQEIHWPDAGYIAIHFSEFDLAKGYFVDITSPDGTFR